MGAVGGNHSEQSIIDERVGFIFREFEHRRAPQASSRSLSPYLLANSFNVDVTEILLEVKEAREK